MPLDLVSQLMLRCDAKGKLLPPKLSEARGSGDADQGTFCQLSWQRWKQIAPDRRVWVLMEIMGGQTRVAVGADQLRTI